MKICFSLSLFSKVVLGVLILLGSLHSGWAQDITEDTIIEGRKEYLNTVTLKGVDTKLTVKGTGILIVRGDLVMEGNKSSLNLEDGSVVIIYGDLIASNNVTISAQSHLIIYGSLTRTTGSSQGTANFDNGNVYIFGEVDSSWGLQECDSSVETCDYGNEEDFLDGEVPEEVQDAFDCFTFPYLTDIVICEGSSSTLRGDSNPAGESYIWQASTVENEWTDISSPSPSPDFQLNNVSSSMNGTRYRVVVKSTTGTCKYGVSEPVSLTVEGKKGTWTGDSDSSWNNPQNWACDFLPDSTTPVLITSGSPNYPVIGNGNSGFSANITIEPDASLLVLGTLNISGILNNTGFLNAENGTLAFTGLSTQSIPPNSFTGNQIKNLIIDNPAGVSLEGVLNLNEILSLSNGEFITNSYFTLISDATKTALISGRGNGRVVGNVKVQRYLNPAYGYKYISSPVTDATVGDFISIMNLKDSTTNFPHFYSYKEDRTDTLNNDLSGWEAYTDPSGPLKILEGYALNFGAAGGAVTIELSGEVNNGPQTRILSNHNGTYTGGFHLVGNPYPSPIDWDSSAWTRENIDDAIYFFSAGTTDPYTGAYRSYVNGLSSDGNTTGIIPSMQGFFVHVNEIAPEATLSIDNGARVEDFSQEFHKSAQKKKTPLLRISAGFEGEETSDPTVIYLDRNASTAFDSQLDAYKLMNTHSDVPSLYSLSPKQEELSINAIASTLSQGLARIPLGYKTLRAGNLELQLRDLDLPPGFHIYLVDLEKGLYIDLQKQKTYTTPINKGSSDRRFEVVLSEKAISDPAKLLNIPMSVYGNKEKLTVTLNLEQENSAEITVSTLTGQVVESITTSSKKVEIEGIKSAGVYIINLRSGKTHYTKKILIK